MLRNNSQAIRLKGLKSEGEKRLADYQCAFMTVNLPRDDIILIGGNCYFY